MNASTIFENVKSVSEQFAQNRGERQLRRELVKSDFDQLRNAGYLLTGVPVEMGGIWENTQKSTRDICNILRILAHGDSSVALVSSMHPAVLSFWLATPEVTPPYQDAWEKQCNHIFQTALDGAFWGTITSEPGSGGDIAKTKTIANKLSTDHQYKLSGQKHFGSGSGMTSYMITTALEDGTKTPDLFFMNIQDVPFDGSGGVKMIAPWNGHGMIATQSHGMEFKNFPATRCAWPGHIYDLAGKNGAFNACLFTAVIVGIVEVALEAARQRLSKYKDSLRSYEQVEWIKAESEGWLIQQAFEGMLSAVEEDNNSKHIAIQGKMVIAELAESVTRRICRVTGGGSFSRHSPYGFWFEDVRALGFLRPPWGLTYHNLFESQGAD